MACKHHFDAGQLAARDPAIELCRQMSDRLGHAFRAGRHWVNPCHRPAQLPRRRSASAAENKERIVGSKQFFGGVEDVLVETADKPVFSRAQNERSAGSCCSAIGSRFGQEEQSATDRGRHCLRIAAYTWKRALRFLYAHARERPHCANNIKQLAHAENMGFDFDKPGHCGWPVAGTATECASASSVFARRSCRSSESAVARSSTESASGQCFASQAPRLARKASTLSRGTSSSTPPDTASRSATCSPNVSGAN